MVSRPSWSASEPGPGWTWTPFESGSIVKLTCNENCWPGETLSGPSILGYRRTLDGGGGLGIGMVLAVGGGAGIEVVPGVGGGAAIGVVARCDSSDGGA